MSSNESLKKTAAIVLGGGLKKVQEQGQTRYEPGEQAKERLDKAYALFKEGKVDYIITTGKYSKRVGIDPSVTGSQTEAQVGREYLIAKAIGDPAGSASPSKQRIEDCVLYENQSFDTIGNAWFAKKVRLEPFNITSCIIITSDYHIKRSKLIFEWVLGPEYAIECIEIPSKLSGEERAQRERLEQILINYVNTYLLGSIAPGDDEAIKRFMENEHLRYCLSERSEAMLNVFIDTATIKAGYEDA